MKKNIKIGHRDPQVLGPTCRPPPGSPSSGTSPLKGPRLATSASPTSSPSSTCVAERPGSAAGQERCFTAGHSASAMEKHPGECHREAHCNTSHQQCCSETLHFGNPVRALHTALAEKRWTLAHRELSPGRRLVSCLLAMLSAQASPPADGT